MKNVRQHSGKEYMNRAECAGITACLVVAVIVFYEYLLIAGVW